ncbi:unnamed protein product [Haemonchus placei]|uniref:Neur_chan_LBD domain-containing protein n=1 Tax=Haemonchus placei TaxID=6290 RepID=A0A0N4WR78_HAEPC|nr:unnamed protein product [Haemonchus placei]
MCCPGSAMERWTDSDKRWILVAVHWVFPFAYILPVTGRDIIGFKNPTTMDVAVRPDFINEPCTCQTQNRLDLTGSEMKGRSAGGIVAVGRAETKAPHDFKTKRFLMKIITWNPSPSWQRGEKAVYSGKRRLVFTSDRLYWRII